MQISSSSLNRSVQASTEVPEHASLRRRSVSVLSVNVGGLTTFKLNVLREVSRDADVLMLQEVNKQGYKRLEQEVNVSQRAGRWFLSKQPNCSEGVATFLCQELSERVVGVQTPSDRILKVVVSLNGKAQAVLVNCYAPHSGKSADDYKKILSQLKKVTSKVNKRRLILIGGDLNAQLNRNFKQDNNRYGYSHRSNRNGKMLERWLLQHEYEVVNFKFKTGRKKEKKHATYYQKGNSRIKSEIDFFVTNNLPLLTSFRIVKNISAKLYGGTNFDHQAIEARFLTNLTHKSFVHKEKPDVSLLLKDRNLVQLVNDKIGEKLREMAGEEAAYEDLNSAGTVELVAKKRREFSTATRQQKKDLTAAVKASALVDRNIWLNKVSNKIQQLFRTNRTREAFAVVNRLKPKKKLQARINTDSAGNRVDVGSRLRILKEYMEKQQIPPTPKIQLAKSQMEHYHRPIFEPALQESIDVHPPTQGEVLTTIKQLKNNRAPGLDNIPNELLKTSVKVQKLITRKIQNIFRNDSIPNKDLKILCSSKIIHIYKQKGSKNEPSSYRPIALLNTTFKLLTKIINNRLTDILEKLPSYQAGFRSNFSTMNKIEVLNSIVKHCLRKNQKLKLLFVDFQKAFDSVDHRFIQISLKEHHVPKKLRKIIKSLYEAAEVRAAEGNKLSESVNLRRGVLQGDSLSPAIFVVVLNSVMKRINHSTLTNLTVAGMKFNYLAFADDIVTICDSDEQISNFVNQLQTLEPVSGLRINISKTKILLTDEGYEINEDIPDEDINLILSKFYCETCDRYFETKRSYDAHCRSRFCDGTRNHSRKGTLAVLHTKEILEQKLQPSAVPVTVNGECIEPVKSYKYLGMEFNSAGISVNSILQKLELCEIRLNKYRDFIQSPEIWNATKRNLVRALVLSPGLYSLVNWPEDERINKKLHMLSRKIKAAIENIHIKEVRIQEGDLDVCKIVQDLKDKYNRTEKTLHDEQLTSLRLSNINNNLQPKRPREISYLEVQDRLNWNPTPPTEPPPEQSQQEESNLSNTPPTPNRISPIAIARTMSRYKRQRLATINPLEYTQTMLAVNESIQNP
eukprot:augustus_masked-scaffold_7-processed-gene-15.47-mRNA-1 protein AED:1.00 eAED:1.00 QI:0/0/0/0/1/1/2/0/1077